MKLLENKVALVTGGSRGIGKAIALAFAAEACDVVITARSESEAFRTVLQELSAAGVRAEGHVFDVADFEACQATVKAIAERFGRIDILVNNAGINRDNLLLRMSEAQWDEVLNVNLKSAFNLSHAVLPLMMKQRAGSIINISSVVALEGNAGQANYAAAKAGLTALTRSLAKEMGSRNIRANAIAPGFILTDMTAAVPEEKRSAWCCQIPLKRIGTPEDVAAAAVFLASDKAAYITGQTLRVDGGM